MKTVKFLGVKYPVGEWITDGTPPGAPGVYNVSCRKHTQSGFFFAHWDGRAWSLARDLASIRPGYDWENAPRLGGGSKAEVPRGHWHINGSYRGLLKPHEEQNETV
jgi:hypothetical protein